MIAVVDTNVLVSGLISPRGTPARIAEHWRQDRFTLLLSAPLLVELRRVLTYPKIIVAIQRTPEEVNAFLQHLALIAVPLTTRLVNASRDPDDNRFIEAAVAGGADYLVTGDRDLLDIEVYEGIEIVTPARFVAILETTPA